MRWDMVVSCVAVGCIVWSIVEGIMVCSRVRNFPGMGKKVDQSRALSALQWQGIRIVGAGTLALILLLITIAA